MSIPTTPATPAGWYPDPAGTGGKRWWNGVDWTGDVQAPYVAADTREHLVAPAGTPAYNVFTWIIVALLGISVLSTLTVDIEAQILAGYDEGLTGVPAQFDPVALASQLAGYLIYGLLVLFAFFDWRKIRNSGVQKPFHWAWAFLSILVYLIGRAVIMKRRVGRGMATMWIAIAYLVFLVAYFIIVIGIAISMMLELSSGTSTFGP